MKDLDLESMGISINEKNIKNLVTPRYKCQFKYKLYSDITLGMTKIFSLSINDKLIFETNLKDGEKYVFEEIDLSDYIIKGKPNRLLFETYVTNINIWGGIKTTASFYLGRHEDDEPLVWTKYKTVANHRKITEEILFKG